MIEENTKVSKSKIKKAKSGVSVSEFKALKKDVAAVNDSLSLITSSLGEITKAINNPVIINRGGYAPEDNTVGQDHPRALSSSGDASLEPAYIQPVKEISPTKAAAEKFNEEYITIRVAESSDPNAELVVETWCNGISQRFIRGQEHTVKRKFVEVLARSRRTTFSQKRYLNELNEKEIGNIPRTVLSYPFEVTEDANPNGKAWLRTILAQA